MNMNMTILGQLISFSIFVWFCMKYVWPPILAALEERETRIADGLAAAERGKHELELAEQRATEAMDWLIPFFGLIVGFLVYDLLFKALAKQHAVAVVIWGLIAIGYGYYLREIQGFSMRAMYIHVAALFGTAMAAKLALELPNSRTAESEADRIGIELATLAGYKPEAAVSLWNKMKQAGGGGGPQFLSTHPAPSNRRETLQRLVPQMRPYYEQSKASPVPTYDLR